MADCMEFPKRIEEFLDDYSFKDKEEVYTNGSILIPLFRVKQGLEHYMSESKAALEKQIPKKVILGYDEQDSICCPNCKGELMSKEIVAQKILHIINEQPTVNVEKVRQGKWERSEKSFSYYQYKCNNCGCDDYTQTDRQGKCKLMNYCPNCGAKMDKEQE